VRHRSRAFGALILLSAPLLVGAAPPGQNVSASVTGLRSTKGQILGCMTAQPQAFPGCEDDPQARRLTVPATTQRLDFGAVPAGRYAIALIHDENGNGRLDKRLVIPREGFGFSQDAPVMMGPPPFAKAAFTVGEVGQHLTIRMRYLL